MLADLDELLLRCRDERAKAYISEALACYKSGANRAAIIAIWIAVTFDIIDKLRQLALTGDKAATEVIAHFDGITESQNVQAAQTFERELLKVARDRFELISPQEYLDLERLQADRHRCAHPSHSAVGEVFSPTSELARFHIRSAVEHLLQQEPSQGKAALEGLLSTIGSNYFPTDEKKALAILEKSPLKRARASLVRNLTLVLLKEMLKPGQLPFATSQSTALLCMRTLHPAIWQETIRQNFSALARPRLSAPELVRIAEVAAMHPDLAAALESDQIVKLSAFFENLPSEHITSLLSLVGTGLVSDAVSRRIRFLSLKEMTELADDFIYGLAPEIAVTLMERYLRATSFDDANAWGKLLQANLYPYSATQLIYMLQRVQTNDQIMGSFQLPHLLTAIKKTDHGKDKELAALINAIHAVLD